MRTPGSGVALPGGAEGGSVGPGAGRGAGAPGAVPVPARRGLACTEGRVRGAARGAQSAWDRLALLTQDSPPHAQPSASGAPRHPLTQPRSRVGTARPAPGPRSRHVSALPPGPGAAPPVPGPALPSPARGEEGFSPTECRGNRDPAPLNWGQGWARGHSRGGAMPVGETPLSPSWSRSEPGQPSSVFHRHPGPPHQQHRGPGSAWASTHGPCWP